VASLSPATVVALSLVVLITFMVVKEPLWLTRR
jgi:hypothetical protein